MTLNQNTRYMPVISFPNDPSNGDRIWTLDNDILKNDTANLAPVVKNVSDASQPLFDFYFMDGSAIRILDHNGTVIGQDGSGPHPVEQSVPYPFVISDATKVSIGDLRVTANWQTIVRVVHVGTGATGIVTIKVLKSDIV